MRLTTILGKSCLTLLVAASACHGLHQQRSPLPEPIVLIVRNDGFFDVNVYAMPSPGSSPVRLAMVTGSSSATLHVPVTDLQQGYVLVVRCHAIGTRYWWTSPSVTVDESSIARLDIATDHDGNMSRSTLYTSVSTTTTIDSVSRAGRAPFVALDDR